MVCLSNIFILLSANLIKSNYIRSVLRAIDAELVKKIDALLMPFSMGDEKRHQYLCQATIVGAQWHPCKKLDLYEVVYEV